MQRILVSEYLELATAFQSDSKPVTNRREFPYQVIQEVAQRISRQSPQATTAVIQFTLMLQLYVTDKQKRYTSLHESGMKTVQYQTAN